MKHPCAFHPTRTAHWICPKCGSAFCPECIIRREKGGYEKKASIHLCPKCNLPAQWIGISGIIDPFWKRLPKIFLYPFSLQPMLLMLGLAVVEMFFATPGFLNFMIKCVIYCVMLKYAFAAMKATASGDLTPPGLTAEAISEDFGVVFKQYGIYFAIGLLFFFAAAALGPIGGVTALIFLLLSIPAMIILLVTTGRLRNALNPTLFVPLMLRIGWGYLLMYLFLFFLLSAPGAVLRLVLPMFPQALATFVRALAGNFYILVGYHLMGYVLLQYHEEIGYRVDFEQFKDPGASAGPALSDSRRSDPEGSGPPHSGGEPERSRPCHRQIYRHPKNFRKNPGGTVFHPSENDREDRRTAQIRHDLSGYPAERNTIGENSSKPIPPARPHLPDFFPPPRC